MNTRTLPVVMLAGLLLGLLGACADEGCERPGDCPSDQECVDGACQTKPYRPPGPPFDAGPIVDTGLADSGTVAADAGLDAGEDAGPDASVDAGPDAGGDAGLDAGSDAGSDAGVADGGVDGGVGASPFGYAWIGEYIPGTALVGHIAEAKFFDAAASNITTSVTTFPGASANVSCDLIVRSFMGTTTGYTAQRIEVSGFQNGRFTTITLRPGSNAWEFETNQTFVQGIFFGFPDENVFDIVSTNTAGTLDTFSIRLPPGPRFAPQVVAPLQGTTVFATLPITLSWSATQFSGIDTATIELADAERNVVLFCQVPDANGQMAIPEAARMAFLAAQPTVPVVLELRYQEQLEAPVPLVGGGSVPTVFRLSNAIRWSVQL